MTFKVKFNLKVKIYPISYIQAPRGQNVAAIALDRRFLGTIIAVFKM